MAEHNFYFYRASRQLHPKASLSKGTSGAASGYYCDDNCTDYELIG